MDKKKKSSTKKHQSLKNKYCNLWQIAVVQYKRSDNNNTLQGLTEGGEVQVHHFWLTHLRLKGNDTLVFET